MSDKRPMLATTDTLGTVALWQITGKHAISVFQTENGTALNALCFTPDGKRLAVAGMERSINVYDIQQEGSAMKLALPKVFGSISSVQSHHHGPVVCIRADPATPHLMYSGGIG